MARKAKVSTAEVPDPYEPGKTLSVARNLNTDGITRLAAQKKIDGSEMQAAERF